MLYSRDLLDLVRNMLVFSVPGFGNQNKVRLSIDQVYDVVQQNKLKMKIEKTDVQTSPMEKPIKDKATSPAFQFAPLQQAHVGSYNTSQTNFDQKEGGSV